MARKILNVWPQGVSLCRGTLWRGSQEPREMGLEEAGTERHWQALRSSTLRRFRESGRTNSIHLCVGLMPALEPLGDGVQFGIVATLRLDLRDSG